MYYTKEQCDFAWEQFAKVVRNAQEAVDMSQKWHDMAKQSSRTRLLKQKQDSLRRGKMFIGGLV